MPAERTKKSKKAKKTYAPPFRFEGARLEFLETYTEGFMEHVAVEGALRRRFWPILLNDYWSRFPWRLPIDCEPHESMNDPVPMDLPPTREEAEHRMAIIIGTESRIKCFYFHKRVMMRRQGLLSP
ncbi:hypothetical protein C8R47DRAFT_1071341 [Mycena vitilis]|nr:hypothetical protein C8R47DRAFT_1216463 [Mycena vitilis]KAJ6490427.1 hypothetical protein C8R47DRAFT_1071341 [Mycena vitilis]